MTINALSPVKNVALQHPAAIPVLEELGIDYCCHGERSLKEACAAAQVSFERVIGRIELAEEDAGADCWNETADWQTARLKDLATRIVNKHHAYVYRQIPVVRSLLASVVAQHGSSYEELFAVQDIFQELADELTAHMYKEELILFPYIARIEHLAATPSESGPYCTVTDTISLMAEEHDSADKLLRRIRTLTGNYRPPDRNCMVLFTLYASLKEFETDLHLHIHLENNILFPRAAALQSARVQADPIGSC